jgi:hypothetical protein
MERGGGGAASIETWASVAVAVGSQLAAFLEGLPGATRPRDYEHLRRQQLVVDAAATGGWKAMVERRVGPISEHGPAIDVWLERPPHHEIAVVEIWDWFDDVGGAWRGLDGKVASVRREHAAGELLGSDAWRVSGLIVVRATQRNRALVREFGGLFRAKFPASGRSWLAALASDQMPTPDQPGFLWTDVRGTRLFAARW